MNEEQKFQEGDIFKIEADNTVTFNDFETLKKMGYDVTFTMDENPVDNIVLKIVKKV